jgi:isopentenyl-diphosphate delta-isomerase type 1
VGGGEIQMQDGAPCVRRCTLHTPPFTDVLHLLSTMGNKNLSAAGLATPSTAAFATTAVPSSSGGGIWDASMSQSQFMARDTVLVVDTNDNIIGSSSKYDSHIFCTNTPRGILHRAFSVFLFEEDDIGGGESRLLLQKRASTKITFPNVWTNTCCSHPLHGMIPNEVDMPCDVQSGDVRGVKYAAIRKLGHELGIKAEELKVCHLLFTY